MMKKKKQSIIDMIIDSGLITEGAHIIIGLSGGPDSLCLLHSLSKLADSMNLTLIPVHINHKLRPEADAEEENVIKICDKLGLECETFEADCKGLADELRISTEEAGRQIRYEIFDDEKLETVASEYITKCEDESTFPWRYYYIKYPAFRPGSFGKLGMIPDHYEQYMFAVLQTKSQFSENTYIPYLME